MEKERERRNQAENTREDRRQKYQQSESLSREAMVIREQQTHHYEAEIERESLSDETAKEEAETIDDGEKKNRYQKLDRLGSLQNFVGRKQEKGQWKGGSM